jgi:predicted phosphohydrolase
MGFYDTVLIPCPTCGLEAEFQSKGGSCSLNYYWLNNAPEDVLGDVNRHAPIQCQGCGLKFEVDLGSKTPIVAASTTLAWLTDIHLDTTIRSVRTALAETILAGKPQAILLTGDISNGEDLREHLLELRDLVGLPIYFVLGNHDYWGRRMGDVREEVKSLAPRGLVWLRTGPVELSPTVVLLGDDGWYDGRAGNYYTSGFRMKDPSRIAEFHNLGKDSELALMQRLADESTERIARQAREAARKYPKVVIATHVPPFVRACTYRGGPTSLSALPFYCNERMGQALVDVACDYPSTQFTVLAGHTHGEATYRPVPNLLCQVGEAEYQDPKVQDFLRF